MRYGLPYQGSKSRIAKKIVDLLPPAEVFVDVFAGGCAVTHAALEKCIAEFEVRDLAGASTKSQIRVERLFTLN